METAIDKNEFRSKSAAISYVMGALAKIDAGKSEAFDFVATADVDGFCKATGFKQSWAGRTYNDIAPLQGQIAVNIVPPEEARIILDMVRKMIVEGLFKSRDGTRFDKTVLNDFLPKSKVGFEGEPTLGHIWEWQYALAVELEHGRTRGTNVTNNHPLLTGLVVMAHLAEDKLYYARLLAMELEGELSNAVLEGKPAKDIADLAKRHQIARIYLGRRLDEKLSGDLEIPG